MNTIQLTEVQKKCAEYPLDQKILVINADLGTGKTEVLKQREIFIYDHLVRIEQVTQAVNQQQRKLILVLAYGRNIDTEIRTKLNSHGIKVYRRLKYIQPLWNHQHTCTSPNKCPTNLENMR